MIVNEVNYFIIQSMLIFLLYGMTVWVMDQVN